MDSRNAKGKRLSTKTDHKQLRIMPVVLPSFVCVGQRCDTVKDRIKAQEIYMFLMGFGGLISGWDYIWVGLHPGGLISGWGYIWVGLYPGW